jgi:hypothetical protein
VRPAFRSYAALLADRAEADRRHEARLAAAEEASAAQLVALDSHFQAKLVHEMERLRELGAAKDELNARRVQAGRVGMVVHLGWEVGFMIAWGCLGPSK